MCSSYPLEGFVLLYVYKYLGTNVRFLWWFRGFCLALSRDALKPGTHGTKILIAGIVYCYTSE